MILLSTDKAVYPINAMGISKAIAEKILISKSKELKKKRNNNMYYALWKCNEFKGISYTSICKSNKK